MGYLRDEDFDDLPDDDGDAFVRLEGLSRERLHDSETDNNGNLTYTSLMRYMNEVTALAEQFGLSGISYDDGYDDHYSEYGRFTRKVEFQMAQIRVQRARRRRKNSVALSGPGRERIQHHLERLKTEIEAAELPEKRKAALRDKLTEFEAELSQKRFNLVAAAALFALIAATSNDFVGTLTEAPKLVNSIASALGAEKLKEDEAAKLLSPSEPIKSLTDMRPKPTARPAPAFDSDLDDDVPF